MNERTRRRLIWLAAMGLIACGSALVTLRLGRPLFYTDGAQEIFAGRLVDAPMLVWQRPEPLCELPGPVQGRAAELPDGRLLYGRALPDGSSDLVAFDPRRPDLPPEVVPSLRAEPAHALHHDLAPAMAADGTLYFASDRPGGAGGFDIWRARWRNGTFVALAPLPAAVNSALDETDPAPDPRGLALVFVRRDPALADGKNGELMQASLEGARAVAGQAAAPLLAPERSLVLRREPCFAADGVSLWFVQERATQPPQTMCTWRLQEHFATPVALELLRGFRAPECSGDGTRLLLLSTQTPNLLYASHARAVYPWWAAQRMLELLLVSLLVFWSVLLALLLLGRRWKKLDIITWCLLLSLLIHVLLLLWLGRMHIIRHFAPLPSEAGRVEVELVAGGGGGERSDDMQGSQSDPSRDLAFAGAGLEVRATAPGSELERTPAPAPEMAELSDAEPAGQLASAAAAVRDAPQAAAARNAAEAAPALAKTALERVEPAAVRLQADKSEAPEGKLEVEVPRADAMAAQSVATVPLPQIPQASAAAPQSSFAAQPVAVRDAPQATLPRAQAAADRNDDAPSLTPLAVAAAAAPHESAAESPQPSPGSAAAAAMQAAMPRAEAGLPAVHSAALPPSMRQPLPSPRSLQQATALHDAVSPREAVAAAAKGSAAPPALRPLDAPAMPGPSSSRAAASPVPELTAHSGGEPAAPAAPATELGRVAPPLPDIVEAGHDQLGPSRRFAPAVALHDMTAKLDAPVGKASSAGPSATLLEPQALAVASPLPVTAPVLHRQLSGQEGLGAVAAGIVVPGSFLGPAPRRPVTVVEPVSIVQPSLYSNRFGPKKAEALEHFGGSAATERAVQSGLRYLARVQQDDGSWGMNKRVDRKYGETFVGKSALCLLAFLGAGHTPRSHTEYSSNVERVVQYLLDSQDSETGHFGVTSSYSHGVTTYALAECYALTRDERLHDAVQRAIDWILKQQSKSRDRRNQGGWGYFSPRLEPEDHFSRASISAWMVMALESARQSGIAVPEDALSEARAFLLRCFDEEHGYFLYNFEPSRLRSTWRTLPASTPASTFALLLTGTKPSDHRIRMALHYVLERAPREYRSVSEDEFVRQASGNVYFWYYGSLACFLAGGSAWEEWNAALKKVLPAAQETDGSFDPIDTYAHYAGDTSQDRAYTTAMCVLSLEVYYRYLTPMMTKGR